MCVSVRAPLAPPVRIHGEVIAPLSGNRETFSIDSDPHQSMMRDGVKKGGMLWMFLILSAVKKSREKSPLLTLYLKEILLRVRALQTETTAFFC